VVSRNAGAAPGAQWFALSGANTSNTAPHGDMPQLGVRADSNVLFETDDGGIYRLRNAVTGSPVWESAIGSLVATEFLTIAYDSVHNTVFGSCWDNSIPRETTPNDPFGAVNENFYADGMQVGVDNGTRECRFTIALSSISSARSARPSAASRPPRHWTRHRPWEAARTPLQLPRRKHLRR
jgi:hypothetical protein